MTSVGPHFKTIPSESAYFINVGALGNKIMNYQPNTVGFSTAQWCTSVAGNVANTTGGAGVSISSILGTAGSAILKDLGKTVVSSLRTFRKVQLVTSSISSGVTIGAPVSSQNASGSTPVVGEEYFTGYIELPGQNGTGNASGGAIAPVARLG